MKKNDIAVIFCRVFVLYIINEIFITIGQIPSYDLQSSLGEAAFAGNISLLLLQILFAGFLWTKTDWVSKRILSDSSLDKGRLDTKLTYEDIQKAGFTIVGMFMFVDAINSIPNFFVYFYKYSDGNLALLEIVTHQFITQLTKIILAIFLILGSEKIVQIIKSARR